jgi:hypothetical protein
MIFPSVFPGRHPYALVSASQFWDSFYAKLRRVFTLLALFSLCFVQQSPTLQGSNGYATAIFGI